MQCVCVCVHVRWIALSTNEYILHVCVGRGGGVVLQPVWSLAVRAGNEDYPWHC